MLHEMQYRLAREARCGNRLVGAGLCWGSGAERPGISVTDEEIDYCWQSAMRTIG